MNLVFPHCMLICMKAAIVSDIHANLEALQAVVEDARGRNFASFLCLGDVVGYGADPNACVRTLRDLRAVAIMGNHDEGVVGGHANGFNCLAGIALEWTRSRISHSTAEWLASCHYTMDLGDAVLCHGTLANPKAFNYLIFADAIAAHFVNQDKPLAFVGHTHVPACYHAYPEAGEIQTVSGFGMGETIEVDPSDGTYWVFNVGSVGRPRDLCRNARYATIEGPERGPYRITLREVEYDAEAAARKIREAGLPVKLADSLLPRPRPNVKNTGKGNVEKNS